MKATFLSITRSHSVRRTPHVLALASVVVLGFSAAACGGPSSSTPSSVNDLITAGLRAQANGDLTTALNDYKSAVAQDPHNKFAYYDLGLVQQLMAQPTSAEQNYRAALQLDPNFVAALYNLAILRTTPSPSEAEELYRHVISLQPSDAAAHLNLGFLLLAENRTPEGDTELNTAVQLDPTLASRIPPGTLATPEPPTPSPTHR